MKLTGKASWFGGPDDTGVAPDEGLAFIYELDDAPHLFLPVQPAGTTGLARRLDPDKFYIACRWDYDVTSKEELLELRVIVRAKGKEFVAQPADWGPHEDTGRVADLSPGLMNALGIETDDEVEVLIPVQSEEKALTIVISAGHGLYVRGAQGPPPWGLDEVDEARKVTSQVAAYMREGGAQVFEYYENSAHTQEQNLANIVDYHNSQARDLDISVHFNAYDTTAHGTEVLYVSQETIARQLSAAIAGAGQFTDRGAKYRNNLYFLNQTSGPAVLIELAFCDHRGDCELYRKNFEAICLAIAETITAPAAAI